MAPRTSLVVYGVVFAVVFAGLPYYTFDSHYKLPTPLATKTHALTGLPQVNEAAILQTARTLSETFGYRTVGTREHALADAWVHSQALKLAGECPAHLQCEVWRQVGSGSHRFDMMGKILFKNYQNLTNIIIRISNGTPEGKENAVLVNAHIDSTLPSPGAADDALSVGVMLDVMRVLIHTPRWTPEHAIILLFNNAEESLQDGSHLYSTQHETRFSVRAAVNLEAAGNTGPELLFQATSEEMIHAYSHSARPYGTIVANEIFSSGILLSDTDFRQFEEYLNVTGLDMAVVGNSYTYHTRRDTVDNIESGVAQHMAENTLGILRHLTSKASPLPSLEVSGFHKPSTTFFSILGGLFFQYSSKTAMIMHIVLAVTAAMTIFATQKPQAIRSGVFAVLGSGLGAVIGSNILAFYMDNVAGRGLSWFTNEMDTILLYSPAAFAGALTVDLLFPGADERTVLAGQILLQSVGAVLLQGVLKIGSSVLLFLSAASLFTAYALDAFLGAFSPAPRSASTEAPKPKPKGKGKAAAAAQRYSKKTVEAVQGRRLHVLAYALGQTLPLILGIEMLLGTLDVFVPLMGRIGSDAPTENIIATVVALFTSFTLPMALPLARRAPQGTLRWIVLGLWAVSALTTGVFLRKDPFDAEHQRRVFIVHVENTTSNEFSLNVGAADRGPGFGDLVTDIATSFGAKGEIPALVKINEWNTEWDVLYPFSHFISSYKIPLAAPSGYQSTWSKRFTVTKTTETVDTTSNTRGLTLSIQHPGVIWTVLAFDADVLSWSLSSPPPRGMQRHHIKEASFYGIDDYSLDLVLRGTAPLSISFIGISERAMWPGKKHEAEGPAMDLFKELDPWMDRKTAKSVDTLLIGCVAGIVEV